MDLYRDGQLVTICDGCYRRKRHMPVTKGGDMTISVEPGWTREMVGGGQQSQQETRPGVVEQFTQAPHAVDYCPDCQWSSPDPQPPLNGTAA